MNSRNKPPCPPPPPTPGHQAIAAGPSRQWQRCPVCGGNGIVPNGFYTQTTGEWTTASTAPERCRSCGGLGRVL